MSEGPIIRRPTLGALLVGTDVDPGEARAALAAHDDGGEESPWAIRVLVGAGAWLCAIILIVLAIIVQLADGGAAIFTGLVAIGVGVALRRTAGAGSVFRTQFALSLSLAGHGLVIGFTVNDGGVFAGAMVAATLGGLMLVAMPDPVHRFLSTGLATLGLTLALYTATGDSPWAVTAALVATAGGLWAVFRAEPRWQAGPWADLHLPLGFGLAASLAALSMPWLIPDFSGHGGVAIVLPLALAVATLAAEHQVIATLRPSNAGRVVAGVALLAAAIVIAQTTPGVAAAALAVVIAVHRGHPVLFGGATLFFVVFLGAWYYQMELTLFAKAGALAGAGVLVLLARALIRGRRAP